MKEKLRKPLTALMMAWGTYLAIPCPYKVWDDALRPWQIVCLPPVGLVVGGIWALCAGIFAKLGFTGFLAAAILAAVPFLVTGFFHLDGFLDCCDAILSRRDLATRQKILKDSRVGAFAVVSAVLLFLLSFAALADCSFSLIWRALLLIPVVTRCMAGVAVETFAPMEVMQRGADLEGEAAIFLDTAPAEGQDPSLQSGGKGVRIPFTLPLPPAGLPAHWAVCPP